MFSIISKAVGSLFQSYRLYFYLIAAVGVLSSYGAVYLKGRFDCNAAHELASAKAVIAAQSKTIKWLEEQAAYALRQTEEFHKIEEANDQVGPSEDDPSPTPCGLDGVWLQRLDQLR
jgi:hypothetical protein